MTSPPTEKTSPPTKPAGETPTAAPSQGQESGSVLFGTDPERLKEDAAAHGEQDLYSGGHISAPIPRWLIVVYVVLFLWALYYGYIYWGGLGPGLDLTVL